MLLGAARQGFLLQSRLFLRFEHCAQQHLHLILAACINRTELVDCRRLAVAVDLQLQGSVQGRGLRIQHSSSALGPSRNLEDDKRPTEAPTKPYIESPVEV